MKYNDDTKAIPNKPNRVGIVARHVGRECIQGVEASRRRGSGRAREGNPR